MIWGLAISAKASHETSCREDACHRDVATFLRIACHSSAASCSASSLTAPPVAIEMSSADRRVAVLGPQDSGVQE